VADGGAETDRRFPEVVLVLVTLVWGGTFLVTQAALEDGGPFGLLLLRFALGAAVLFLAFYGRMGGTTRAEIGAAAAIGVVIFVSYATQTMGLQLIPSSRSAFITALYVPVVPILQLVMLGAPPRPSAWAGIQISFIGLVVLASTSGIDIRLGVGDWLTIGTAITAALQIVLISRWAPTMDPIRLACLQFAAVAILALVAMPIAGEPLPHFTGGYLLAVAALGILGTAFALGAMNWAQQTVSATRATIIYALEPVWAGIFGAVVGEVMTGRTLAGSSLIICGVLVSTVRWRKQ
jgi:drug/metabolite transporter (DMT)-like permease